MTIILGKRADKAHSIHLVEQVLKQFVFNGVKPADAVLIMQHLDWMKRQTNDLLVNCRLETIPETMTTRVVLDLSFATGIKPLVKN